MKGIIIQGSSRNDGNTKKIVEFISQRCGFDIIDLSEKDIGAFDYAFSNKDDDFLPLIRDIVNNYDLILFATPVYWYAMSGIMKTFFDRITDCLQLEKETGRKLRGKQCAMVSCSSGPDHDPVFSRPFEASADYLGMHYLGDVHCWIKNDEIPPLVIERLEEFVKLLTTRMASVEK